MTSDLDMVTANGLDLRLVSKQTAELCWAALKQNPFALYYIEPHRQTHDMGLYAVQICGRLIEYVINQTPAICDAAVKQDPSARELIQKNGHNPHICWFMADEEEEREVGLSDVDEMRGMGCET